MQQQKIIIGNWKMQGNLLEIKNVLQALSSASIVNKTIICPPMPYLGDCKPSLFENNFFLGAQNLSSYEKGAYTGEVSALMLKDYNVEYIIIGHSERRTLFKEDYNDINKKFAIALKHNLIPILCIGETKKQRDEGQTQDIILSQIKQLIDYCGIEAFSNAIIAYEPIWAIGTGLIANPKDAQNTHLFIRKLIAEHNATIANKIPILYGGSVKSDNCKEILSMPDINGVLVGSACTKKDEFIKICLS